MRVSNINRDILQQTYEKLDEAIVSKFPKLRQWLDGSKAPTFNQLADYAKAANVPFGYFFLEKMPAPTASIPHYRTLKNETAQPSANLKAVIELVGERQDWGKDSLLDWGAEPLPFAGKYTVESDVQEVVKEIHQLLGINRMDWASQLPTWQKAFSFLIERTEAAGIFVVVSGIVANFTQRALDVKEFRGFVLYDEIAPFVFINGKDAVAGKVFTLIHEIAHVLIGESASFDLSFDQKHTNAIEQFCNQVAATFLVPEVMMERYYDEGEEDVYKKLARACKVSEIVIARRLLDTGRISKSHFFDFYEEYKNRVVPVKKGGGGDYFKSVPYKISQRFFEIVHTAMQQNNIRPTDAFRLTGLKAKTYDEYLNRTKLK